MSMQLQGVGAYGHRELRAGEHAASSRSVLKNFTIYFSFRILSVRRWHDMEYQIQYMDKIHYTYEIVNKITKQYYRGKRTSTALEAEYDDYWGSSKVLDAAMEEYGKENFFRGNFVYHDTEEAAYAHEGIIVTSETIKDPLCYNQVPGGRFQDAIETKAVVLFDEEGNKIEEFDSVSDCSAFLGLKMATRVSNCCKPRPNGKRDKSIKANGIYYQPRFKAEVGDAISIPPVVRNNQHYGNDTSRLYFLDLLSKKVFDSKRSAFRYAFPNNKWYGAVTKTKKWTDRFKPITKEEYERLKMK